MSLDRKERDLIKESFKTGDRPKQEEFAGFIDSCINQVDDGVYVKDSGTSDPLIGIGTPTPSEKLHVDGNIKLTGHVFGDKTPGSQNLLLLQNEAQIQLYGNDHPANSGGIVIGPKKNTTNVESGKIIFSQNSGNGNWDTKMLIDHNGHIGMGTNDPSEKLHINGNIKTNGNIYGSHTSEILKIQVDHLSEEKNTHPSIYLQGIESGGNWINPGQLRFNAGAGERNTRGTGGETTGGFTFIQHEPNDGYKTLMEITRNGNVGIGTASPSEKLHVTGNVKIEGEALTWKNNAEKFYIKQSDDNGPYIEMFGADHSNDNSGGISFIARGNGTNNGFYFVHHNKDINDWKTSLRIDGEGNQMIYNNTIFFRGDKNHGIGWFGKDSWTNGIDKQFANQNINGPVLFGHNGGALGSIQNSNENMALQWFDDKRVDFKGYLSINQEPFFVRKQYMYKRTDTVDENNLNQNSSNDYKIIEDCPPSQWDAIISNFSYNHFKPKDGGSGQVSVWIEPNDQNTKWKLRVNFPNAHRCDRMVVIFFINKKLFKKI